MEKRKLETIDLTPTWAGILPVLLEVYENAGTPQGRQQAKGELVRMARLADQAVAYRNQWENS